MSRPSRPSASSTRTAPTGLHPRNRHRGRYDFAALAAASPALSAFVKALPGGEASIDFSDPAAVRALNRALLKTQYGIAHWDLPDGYLCPPIPGRADYLHGLADLLATSNAGAIPHGASIRALDIGTGANLIYPLLGHREYGWRFVGTDIDSTALRAAEAIVDANGLRKAIELRHQPDPSRIFAGPLRDDDVFDLMLCNPPFHASADDAARGSERKWRNLGRTPTSPRADAPLNFGGQSTELWCPGGEAAFVRRMIRESARIASRVYWFSTLIAKSEHLADVRKQLQQADAQDVREIRMAQGQKQSRFVAWTFLDATQREAWRALRWQGARHTP
ncbi:MAG: 23S rRNA (adenine(1618)-N(6))-methyltransferase RlmF [Lysobacter sp.]|nr:23S rRNA (adenine(1618)-N(6))-methyltransferase RlmF [Lysobacter sp.]